MSYPLNPQLAASIAQYFQDHQAWAWEDEQWIGRINELPVRLRNTPQSFTRTWLLMMIDSVYHNPSARAGNGWTLGMLELRELKNLAHDAFGYHCLWHDRLCMFDECSHYCESPEEERFHNLAVHGYPRQPDYLVADLELESKSMHEWMEGKTGDIFCTKCKQLPTKTVPAHEMEHGTYGCEVGAEYLNIAVRIVGYRDGGYDPESGSSDMEWDELRYDVTGELLAEDHLDWASEVVSDWLRDYFAGY
jgi:hypothetical protein